MLNLKILNPEVLAGNKMAASAILAEPSKGYNSAIYQPIFVKFETRVHIDIPNIKLIKPEV
jgi:hypothetical protein